MYYVPYKESDTHPTLRDLEQRGVQIFNDWWDTYIPEYKPVLIRKIMHTYYFEQICAETPDKFIHFINSHLENIMPYYNQLYASELIKIDPLLNHSIETSGRTIENLVSRANTTDDKFSKSIREFAGIKDTAGKSDVVGHQTGVTQRADVGHEDYAKTGTEDITDHSHTDGTEDETTHDTKLTDSTKKLVENETTNVTGSRDLTRNTEEKPNEQTVKTMDWGANETGQENVVAQDVSDGTGTKNWTETLDDDSTTHTVTDLDERSSGDSEKDYADTPQKRLDVTPEYGTANVRRDYLTNVTWNNESSTHNADTDQMVTFADDQTKKHDENTTDKNTTDKTSTTDTTKQKGGTDTETSVHTGTNITDVKEHEDSTSDTDRDLTATTTFNETVNEDGTRDLDTTEDTNATRDRDWTERGTKDNTFNSTTNSVADSTTNSTNSGTEQTKENADVTQSQSGEIKKDTQETTDTGTSQMQTGFMNVSASALLEAFRKTFINVDKMIIDELRDNFMLVY